MSDKNWHAFRGGFNHRWLANNYLNHLRYWVSEMEAGGEDGDVEFGTRFVNNILKQWEHRSKEAAWIIEHAQTALSPKTLFEQFPLCRIPEDIREPVSEACHHLWLQRTEKLRKRAFDAKEVVDRAYCDLMKCLTNCAVPLTARSASHCTPLAVAFESACKELNAAFEALPAAAF